MNKNMKENQTIERMDNEAKIESVVICIQQTECYPGFITDLKSLIDDQPAGSCKIKLFIRKENRNTLEKNTFRSVLSSPLFLRNLQNHFRRAVILVTY